jgi:hypothetical protein
MASWPSLSNALRRSSATHAGRPQAEVLTELRRVHDQMGLQLDPSGGVQLAQRISSTNLGS